MCNFALMFEQFLVAQHDSFGTEMLIWVVGIILLLGFIFLLFRQRREGKELESELAQLAKVKKHNVEFELVLKAMKLSTWIIDAEERTITYSNDYREGNYLMQIEIPLDEMANNMIAPSDRQQFIKTMDDVCSGHTDGFHLVCQIKFPNSNKFSWSESYATISARTTEGLPKTIVGTSMRVDDRENMKNALVAARNKAEESDRLKSAFIANMSHEIRTPLNAIIGFTSVLPDVQGEDERRELIGLIQDNNQKLLTIINDVMNISKIESGKEQLVMTTFELNDMLRSVADAFTSKAKEGVTISTMFPQGALEITTDLNRMMEVLNHLMANATKFTDHGSIIIGYDTPVDKRIRIWIRDTGKGIAPEHLDRVFERFFKVDEYIPGAGLGLSICKTMAYSMGGDVGVESSLGEGSTFWLELPTSL